MERYAKVPVRVVRHENAVGSIEYSAHLGRSTVSPCVGIGPTEDEAFANLLERLGYEEAK